MKRRSWENSSEWPDTEGKGEVTGDGAESCGSLSQRRSLDFILLITEGQWQFFKWESDMLFKVHCGPVGTVFYQR